MIKNGITPDDASGKEKNSLTVDVLLDKFRIHAGKRLENDRILLSGE